MSRRCALAGILLLQLITACSQTAVKEQSVDTVHDVAPVEAVTVSPPVLEAVTVIPPVVERSPVVKNQTILVEEKSVAILLGKMTPDNQQIADTIAARFAGNAQVYILNESADSPEALVSAIQKSSHRYVAAIGQFAAREALKLDDKHIVFAEVFNVEDSMLERGMIGVSMLPNPDKLFSAWKNINPNLETVAILTGPGCQDQIKLIRESAKRYKIQLVHREVNNDKEMLYQSEKLISSVQGYWMLPDHRVLSRRSMKDFMSLSLKKSKQVVVFNRQLLDYGGLIYIEAAPEDIGTKLVEQLNNSEAGLVFTSQVNMLVNPVIAEKLSLDTRHAAIEVLDKNLLVQ